MRVRKRGIGHEAEGGRAVLLIVLVVLALAGGGWVAAYAGATGNVPRGTTIAGVDVGGRDRFGAVRALTSGVSDALAEPITLQIGTVTTRVTPAEAGLSVDYVDSVANALGPRSWDPRDLWSYYSGGGRIDPVVNVDSAAMEALLTRLDSEAGQPPRDGAVSIADGTVDVTRPREGATLDHEQAREAIVAAWSAGLHDLSLPLLYTAPTIDQGDVDRAVADLANPALSAPVTLGFAEKQVVLQPQDYTDVVTFVPRDGALALDVTPEAMAGLVDPAAQTAAPVDASVALTNGVPTVVPAVDGATYDAAGVTAAFLQGVTATGAARTVPVTGVPSPAAFTTRDARRLKVKEPVATFTVPVPATTGPSFAEAVARLDGALVRPGETFSFNSRVGAVNGSAGRIATATWNAGFLAGLVDVTRTPSATWSAGMPEGRDADVVAGGADLQMRNDSSYGALLSARVDAAGVTVDVWSTKEFDVSATTGARYAVTPRTTVPDASPTCVGDPGEDGFAVDLVRTVTRVGDPTPVRSDTVTTTYAPVDAVVCQAQ